MPEKINLLIDTNAFSHLSMLEFKNKKLIQLVFKYFNAYTCQTVFDEFGKGIAKGSMLNRATYRLLLLKRNYSN